MGEDYVAGLVEATRRGVADGTVQAFGDTGSFLQDLKRKWITVNKSA